MLFNDWFSFLVVNKMFRYSLRFFFCFVKWVDDLMVSVEIIMVSMLDVRLNVV